MRNNRVNRYTGLYVMLILLPASYIVYGMKSSENANLKEGRYQSVQFRRNYCKVIHSGTKFVGENTGTKDMYIIWPTCN